MSLLASVVDRLLGLRALQRLYDGLPPGSDEDFADRALTALGVAVHVTTASRPVPASGGLVVVANHPFGGLDGLVALAVLRRIRPDVKVLANFLLRRVPELCDAVIPVDPFDRARASTNASGLRAALRWVRQGGCLIAFPAGEVAHRLAGTDLAIDRVWHPHVARMAIRADAPALPLFIAGTNSRTFRAAGHVHPLARTLLLARELLHQRHRPVRVVMGETVAPELIARLPAQERASFLQTRTCVLVNRLHPVPTPEASPVIVPVAPPGDLAALAVEVAGLGADRLLAQSGCLRVYVARAAEVPHVVQEIGRLRELTFRQAGEGTGRAIDLDRFDQCYWHLFAWDESVGRVVGAYRLGATDEIVPGRGVGGLYTSTLFKYDARLLGEIGPALELGRSFVRHEHQREFAPLLVLWKGIGQFVARHPRYRRLFGAVSISNRYDSISRQLLVRFLWATSAHPTAARLVQPRRPPPRAGLFESVLPADAVSSLERVTALLETIERDGKGVPVLLRQYLNLNAKLLGISVDPDFGDALDGLMLVDLVEVSAAVLARFMGKTEARAFLAHHRGAVAMKAASQVA